jgi:hypothetical protein
MLVLGSHLRAALLNEQARELYMSSFREPMQQSLPAVILKRRVRTTLNE